MKASLFSLIPAHVHTLVAFLGEHGVTAYPVGGAVRDLFLRHEPAEWDLAADATPERLMAVLPKAIPTGLKHGTVTAIFEGHSVEITSFRAEGAYSDGRRPDDVRFGVTLKEDLSRRDFTMNAIAVEIGKRRVIDPFGGQADIRKRQVRCVGDPRVRFSEDGLRPLRAIRFAATLGFIIHPATRRAIPKAVGTFEKVSAERVRDELVKMLAADRPSRGFDLMRRTGLLARVIPELLEGVGVRQNRWHRYDVWRHGVKALDESRGDPILRLSVLLHDVGKPRCIGGEGPDHTFYGHEKVSAEMAREIMTRLKFSGKEIETATGLIAHHMYSYSPDWKDGTVRRFVAKVGPELVPAIFELQRADIIAHGVGKRESLDRLEMLKRRIEALSRKALAIRTADLAVDGNDVMEALGIGPGPRVGEILRTLLETVLDDPSQNTREVLLDLAKKVA